MVLDEIVLHNFGLYADRQKVTLTPPDPDKPVILFGGLNGHGKTTLLDALQLCLYGPVARISNRNGLPYREYLSRCLHRNSNIKEAAVEVAFRHTIDGKEDRYRLHRSWRMGKHGCKEHFEVLKNKRRDKALAENWIDQVEDFIPPNIAKLFFFDGEQVESYAAQDNSTQLIGGAIQNLLGLDIVDRLEKDLRTYLRRKRMEDKDDPLRGEIEKAEAVLKDLRTRIADLKQEWAALKTTGIDPARKSLLAVEDEYRKLGGELYEQRVAIERDKAEAESVLEEGAGRLREFAAGDLPLLLVRDLLNAVHARNRKEGKSRRSREVAAILDDRDRKLLREMRSRAVNAGTVEALAAYLREDRKRRRRIADMETVLDLPPEVCGDLHALLRDGLDTLAGNVRSELGKRVEAESRAEHIRLKYAGIPHSDAVSELADRRDALRSEIAACEARYAAMGSEIDHLTRQVERDEQSLLRILETDAKAEGGRRDRARVLRHAGRVRATLDTFRKTVIERQVRGIEQLVLESYRQLLHKASLVTRLAIDPESFALTLYGRDGLALGDERLSAGERQLLAIALLWGLAKASGRPLPTAIDTPLGRLDAGHRLHLVECYFPFVSHQVLLFSTDEEITGTYLDKLQPFIGRSYRLAYDDAAGSTKIVEGYFKESEAA